MSVELKTLRRALLPDSFLWVAGSQSLSSGTNFASGVLVARTLGPTQFGQFSIVFAIWLIALGFNRALIVQPHIVRAAGLQAADADRNVARAAFLVLVTGGLGGGMVILTSIALRANDSALWAGLAVFALFLPVLLIQDFVRLEAISRRRGSVAAISDASFAITLAVGFPLALSAGLTVGSSLLVWGLGALVGALIGLALLGIRPRPLSIRAMDLRQVGRVGGWFALSTVLFSVGTQVTIVVMAASLGSAAVGGLRSAQSLFFPIALLAMAAEMSLLPAASRSVHDGRASLAGVLRRWGSGLLLVALVWSSIVVIGSELALGAVFGASFERFGDLLLPTALSVIVGVVAGVMAVGLRALQDGRRLLMAQVYGTGSRVILVLVAVGLGDLRWAAWTLALASLVHASALLVALIRAQQTLSPVEVAEALA